MSQPLEGRAEAEQEQDEGSSESVEEQAEPGDREARPGEDEQAAGGEEQPGEAEGPEQDERAEESSAEQKAEDQSGGEELKPEETEGAAPGEQPPPEQDQASAKGETEKGEQRPRRAPPMTTSPSEAVEQFDQMGRPPGSGDEGQAGREAGPDGRQPQKPGVPRHVVEQWLNRVEGDPGRLMSNQFLLEERKAWQTRRGELMETRPW